MKKTILVMLIGMAGLVLAACGGKTDKPAATTAFNEADVTFAQDMIPHHRQAVEMSRLAATRAGSPEVKTLADDIEHAQGPEINTMTGWLEEWNQPVPDDMADTDHGDSMPGMMSTQDMEKLEALSGTQFDQMFLTMMIAHHEGAVDMAQTELDEGTNPEAIDLARDVQSTQNAEIDAMKIRLKR